MMFSHLNKLKLIETKREVKVVDYLRPPTPKLTMQQLLELENQSRNKQEKFEVEKLRHLVKDEKPRSESELKMVVKKVDDYEQVWVDYGDDDELYEELEHENYCVITLETFNKVFETIESWFTNGEIPDAIMFRPKAAPVETTKKEVPKAKGKEVPVS